MRREQTETSTSHTSEDTCATNTTTSSSHADTDTPSTPTTVTPASQGPVPMSVTRVTPEEELVDLWYHYWHALRCCLFTISPVFLALVVLLYTFAASSGWENENDYARCGVIIGLAYSAAMVFYFVILLPLIIFTRTVDSALFSNSGSILTSSMVEISILTLFVVMSLLLTSYNTRN